ncbi:hypothetical protein IFT57_07285 [Pseudomonas sp. CFBP 13719]|nr:hypothetical protein [Pseudomonas putida]MBD8681550.1 hypothetical protein [Pseudomonas sp. CFBP 13719]
MTGVSGSAGTSGITGVSGSAGTSGITGVSGSAGTSGTSGSTGTMTSSSPMMNAEFDNFIAPPLLVKRMPEKGWVLSVLRFASATPVSSSL